MRARCEGQRLSWTQWATQPARSPGYLISPGCHRFFAKDMNTGTRGSHRVFTMKVVRYCDVNGFNLAECAIVIFVRVHMIETIFLAQFLSLRRFSRDDGNEF
jgi:hypothetical protein